MNREAKLDCALAELYTKSLATERMLEDRKHADVLTKLYVRINEVCHTNASLFLIHSRFKSAVPFTDCSLGLLTAACVDFHNSSATLKGAGQLHQL